MSFLTDRELATLTAAMDAVIPPDGESPGAGECGGAAYVDGLLGAFASDPPRVFAGGPFSGRHGGAAGFDRWLDLAPIEELAWRIRIEGTGGRPEREFNGPVVGWQERYRTGLAALGDGFAELPTDERLARLGDDPEFRTLVFEHACEALYGDPVYGGNRHGAGWRAIGFDGDVQPRGFSDDAVRLP